MSTTLKLDVNLCRRSSARHAFVRTTFPRDKARWRKLSHEFSHGPKSPKSQLRRLLPVVVVCPKYLLAQLESRYRFNTIGMTILQNGRSIWVILVSGARYEKKLLVKMQSRQNWRWHPIWALRTSWTLINLSLIICINVLYQLVVIYLQSDVIYLTLSSTRDNQLVTGGLLVSLEIPATRYGLR